MEITFTVPSDHTAKNILFFVVHATFNAMTLWIEVLLLGFKTFLCLILWKGKWIIIFKTHRKLVFQSETGYSTNVGQHFIFSMEKCVSIWEVFQTKRAENGKLSKLLDLFLYKTRNSSFWFDVDVNLNELIMQR